MPEENKPDEVLDKPKPPSDITPAITPAQPIKPQDIVKIIDEIDTKKLSNIVEAVISPLRKGETQVRRDILVVMGGLIFVIAVGLLILAALELIDVSFVIFFFATALGYIMGFLSRFFIGD